MGTNTLVKEFVGRKDHKDYIKRGTAVENLLVEAPKVYEEDIL